jgi:hypothetical protein
MKIKILKYILISLKVFLFGSLLSFLLLIYLIISDSYFYKLDFQESGFHDKIIKYFTYTVYTPIMILVAYSILLIVKEKLDKSIIAVSSLFGTVMFISLDRTIKKILSFFRTIFY